MDWTKVAKGLEANWTIESDEVVGIREEETDGRKGKEMGKKIKDVSRHYPPPPHHLEWGKLIR